MLSTFLRKSEIVPVVEAFKRLKSVGRLQKLIVVGKLAPAVAEIPDRYPDAAIEWRGQVPFDQLPAIYRQADILLSSKLRNNCPNIVLEAMASGVPVACYDSGAHRELLGESAGICVPIGNLQGADPPLDAAALAAAAEQILQNREPFSAAARKKAAGSFNLKLMVDRYLEMFQKAVNHHQSK